jgi:hypothetical protein
MFLTSAQLLAAGLALAAGARTSAVPFDGLTPTRAIYVTTGSGSGDGTQRKPFQSIQQAVDSAKPGTIIYLQPGIYNETVKIPRGASGTEKAPVWLVSQGGRGAAQIVGVTKTKPVIQGLGVRNYVIKDLTVSGGYDGIQFSQSGRDFSSLVSNIVIQGNTIKNVLHDGLKIGQADNVYVGGNTIDGVRDEEGIDFVAVTNAVIERNEVSHDGSTAAAIFAKGGSTHIKILGNYVHDVTGDGISVGGWTDATSFKPGFTGYEAKDVTVAGNRIENVGKRPVSVRGASDVTITGNYLKASARYGTAVYVSTGNPKVSRIARSSDVRVANNVLSDVTTILKIDDGNGNGVVESGNAAGAWHHAAGPTASIDGDMANPNMDAKIVGGGF